MLSTPSCRATESSVHSVLGISFAVDKCLSVHHYYLPSTIHTVVTHNVAATDTTDTVDSVEFSDVTAPNVYGNMPEIMRKMKNHSYR